MVWPSIRVWAFSQSVEGCYGVATREMVGECRWWLPEELVARVFGAVFESRPLEWGVLNITKQRLIRFGANWRYRLWGFAHILSLSPLLRMVKWCGLVGVWSAKALPTASRATKRRISAERLATFRKNWKRIFIQNDTISNYIEKR